jgi:hypothetical protein
MVILEHLGDGIARRYEELTGGHADGELVFDEPGVFRRDTMQLLHSVELRRLLRGPGWSLELALAQLAEGSDAAVQRWAEVAYAVSQRGGLAVGHWGPDVLALLMRARPGPERPALASVLATLAREGAPICGTGLVRYRAAGGPLLSQNEIERLADEARAVAAAEGAGRIEHVWVQSEPHLEVTAP